MGSVRDELSEAGSINGGNSSYFELDLGRRSTQVGQPVDLDLKVVDEESDGTGLDRSASMRLQHSASF